MLRMELNQALAHQENGHFLKLVVPFAVLLTSSNDQVFGLVVVLMEIDVMDKFVWGQRTPPHMSCHLSMLSDITVFTRVWMFGVKDVVIAIAITTTFEAFFLFCSDQHPPALPSSVERPHLIPLGCYASLNAHLLHCTPHYLLRCLVFFGDLNLAHSENNIIVIQLLFRKWH